MKPEISSDDIQILWQEQSVAPLGLSISEIRARAETFRSQIAARNARERIAAAVVAVILTVGAIAHPNVLFRVACALGVAASVYVSWYMRAHASPRVLPSGDSSCLAFYRHELERQRDLGRRIWRWYLGPFVPGLAVFVVGWMLADPSPAPIVYTMACTALFGTIAWLNKRAAAELQRRLDALPLPPPRNPTETP